jgi:predicted class III extradiol MEMO1 family dioxygenase
VPEDVIAEMGDFLKLFHTILNFHHYQFYPELKKNGIDMIGIANIFKLAIQQNAFDVYYKYATMCGRVENVLQTYYRGNYKEVGK